MRRLALAFVLVGCGGPERTSSADSTEIAQSPCAQPCVDRDPCTDDHCDTQTGECLFVPRNPELACLYDWHCQAADACSVARCGLDSCDLQRCVQDAISGCRLCQRREQCDDGDPTTIDRCDGGRCASHTSDAFEPRCFSSDGLAPDEVQLEGRVFAPACACPCDGPPLLVNSERQLTLAFSEPDAGCTVGCDALRCEPLQAGEAYVVWGIDGLDHLDVHGFCFDPQGLDVDRAWQGEIQLNAQAPIAITLLVTPDHVMMIDATPCPGCTLAVRDAAVTPEASGDYALQVPLTVTIGALERRVTAYLYPSARGFGGPIEADDASPDRAPLAGTISLEPAP